MSFYSSIYIGNYFLFILNAGSSKPIVIKFRDSGYSTLKTSKKIKVSSKWRMKVYLYQDILQRKWIEYNYNDRFIPSVKYDNSAPIIFNYEYATEKGKDIKITISSLDINYKNLEIFLLNISNDEVIYSKKINSLPYKKDTNIVLNIEYPGIYKLGYIWNGIKYLKKNIIVYTRVNNISNVIKTSLTADKYLPVCMKCLSPAFPCVPILKEKFLYKEYIPFNDLLDTEKYSGDYINSYILKLKNPDAYKRGLIHLLNMIRTSHPEDEIKIMRNIFNEDPAFGYFLTNRVFIFDMIPLLPDNELQEILRYIDDDTVARSLVDSKNEIREKIYNNISSRRREYILKFKTHEIDSDVSYEAKKEINKAIKRHFLKKYGRILKLKSSHLLLYEKINAREINDYLKWLKSEKILHNGEIAFFSENELIYIGTPGNGDICIDYDIDYGFDSIFTVESVTEYAIFLAPQFNIKMCKIHTYNWNNNIEQIETFESIDKSQILAIPCTSDILIVTIGAFDTHNKPYEQVIRIALKETS